MNSVSLKNTQSCAPINLKYHACGKKIIRIPIKGLNLDEHVGLEVTRGAEEEHWPPVLVVFTHRGAHLFRYLRYFLILEIFLYHTRYSTNSTKLGSLRMNRGFFGNLEFQFSNIIDFVFLLSSYLIFGTEHLYDICTIHCVVVAPSVFQFL